MALIDTHAASWPTASATRQRGNSATNDGTANTPRACLAGSSSVMRSTNEKAAKCSSMQGDAPKQSGAYTSFLLRANHQLAKSLRREQPRNVGDLHRSLEAIGWNLGQIGLELRQTLLCDDAFLLKLGLGKIAARVLDNLAARDFDLEGALQPEHHVQEVDRLGVQSLDQRHVELDVLDIAAQRVGHGFGNLGIDRQDIFFGDFVLPHFVHSILKPPSTAKICPVM